MSECIINWEGKCSGTCFDCLNPDAAYEIDNTLGWWDDFRDFVKERVPWDEAPSWLLDRIRGKIQWEPPSSSDNSIQN